MKDSNFFEPGDQDLPEGWDPTAPQDPQLRRILELAKNADRPQLPLPAVFDAMRMDLRHELLKEDLLRPNAPDQSREPGFLSWLRLVMLGGGAGGQMLRLGATAALAFYVGNRFLEAPTSQPANIATVPVPDSTVITAPTAETVQPQAIAPVPAATTIAYDSVPRGVMSEEGWTDTAPTSKQWYYQAGGAQTAGDFGGMQRTVGTYIDNRPDFASQAVEQIQILKINALSSQDERTLSSIRGLEETLAQLMQELEWNRNDKTVALNRFRLAEQVLSAQRYREAIELYGQTRRLLPGSALAMLADFRIGTTAYERLQDYPLATEAFRSCIENYPGLSVSADAKRYITARYDLLNGTRDENWESVYEWQAASRSKSPADAAEHLLKVLQKTSFDELAGDAAIRLRDLSVSPASRDNVDAPRIFRALTDKLAAMPPSPHAAEIQFAIAEINLYQNRDRDAAASQYEAALRMNPDELLRKTLLTRLEMLSRQDSLPPDAPTR